MSNMRNVLAVTIVIKVLAREWHVNAPASLKDFFKNHGNVVREKPADVPAQQPVEKVKGEVFMQSTGNCGLQSFFTWLNNAGWQVFSISYREVDDMVTVKFMLCPALEVEWERQRPYEQMQAALSAVCTMAAYRTMGFDNPYVNPEETREGMRALSVNACNPNWLLEPDGKPLLHGTTPKTPKNRLVIAEDGELKVA